MVRLAELRKIRGWSQEQLAAHIGDHGISITAAGISNVESGAKQASERLLIAWANALGIPDTSLWHGPLRARRVSA
jgi:transcriptional regulator with XRE-family HTH domain